jgi:hypothetical protein
MANGIRKKQQLDEQRRKRAAAAAGLAKGAKSPARPIPHSADSAGKAVSGPRNSGAGAVAASALSDQTGGDRQASESAGQ